MSQWCPSPVNAVFPGPHGPSFISLGVGWVAWGQQLDYPNYLNLFLQLLLLTLSAEVVHIFVYQHRCAIQLAGLKENKHCQARDSATEEWQNGVACVTFMSSLCAQRDGL